MARMLITRGHRRRRLARPGGDRHNIDGLDVKRVEGDLGPSDMREKRRLAPSGPIRLNTALSCGVFVGPGARASTADVLFDKMRPAWL